MLSLMHVKRINSIIHGIQRITVAANSRGASKAKGKKATIRYTLCMLENIVLYLP